MKSIKWTSKDVPQVPKVAELLAALYGRLYYVDIRGIQQYIFSVSGFLTPVEPVQSGDSLAEAKCSAFLSSCEKWSWRHSCWERTPFRHL